MRYIIFYPEHQCVILKIKDLNNVDGYFIETRDSPLYYGIAEKGNIYNAQNCKIEFCNDNDINISTEQFVDDMINNHNGILINKKEYTEIEKIIRFQQKYFRCDGLDFEKSDWERMFTNCGYFFEIHKKMMLSKLGYYFVEERIYDELEHTLTDGIIERLNRIAGYKKYDWIKINSKIDHKKLANEELLKNIFNDKQ